MRLLVASGKVSLNLGLGDTDRTLASVVGVTNRLQGAFRDKPIDYRTASAQQCRNFFDRVPIAVRVFQHERIIPYTNARIYKGLTSLVR